MARSVKHVSGCFCSRRRCGVLAIAVWLGDTGGVNFLAHLVLAPQTPKGLVGSIAPDMIQGPLPTGLDKAVLASAKEHQSIDRVTDAHPAFVQTRDRLAAVVDRRLAGVLADVLYDHVLAKDWLSWRDDALVSFVSASEQGLLTGLTHVPVRMQMIVRKMIDEQWLVSYASSSGIRARLETMSARLTRRLDRPMSLMISESDLATLYPSIADDFAELWPDLLAHVQQRRKRPEHSLANTSNPSR